MKNLYDKEIKEKVSQKQDFDENKDGQNNTGSNQTINGRGRIPSPRPSSPSWFAKL